MTTNDILTLISGLIMMGILAYVAIRSEKTGICDDSN